MHRIARSVRAPLPSSSLSSLQRLCELNAAGRFHFCSTASKSVPISRSTADPSTPEYQEQAAALRSSMLVTRRRIRASPTLPLEPVALPSSTNRVIEGLIASSGVTVRDLRVRGRRGETFRAPEVHSKILRTRKKLRGNARVLPAPDYARNQDALAYVSTRVPGIFAANVHVLTELRRLRAHFAPSSVLDFGAGVGTASAAVARVFNPPKKEEQKQSDDGTTDTSIDGSDAKSTPGAFRSTRTDIEGRDAKSVPGSFRSATLVEPSAEMRRLGEQVLPADPAVSNGAVTLNWAPSLDGLHGMASADLVISSYTLAELARNTMASNETDEADDDHSRTGRARRAEKRLRNLVRSLWARVADGGCLVLVEDGTAAGFETILFARDAVLSKANGNSNRNSNSEERKKSDSATVVAPCLHSGKCPLESSGVTRHRLCRFAQRLNRPLMTRIVKPMPDGFEDEHFSYVVIQKNYNDNERQDTDTETPSDGWGRLVRNPLLRGKHVVLDACTEKGTLQRHVLTKKNSEPGMYHVARKAKWGDVWPVEPKSAPQPVHF